MIDLECPACGAIVEGADLDLLIIATKEHTRDAHNYDIPAEHVVAACSIGEKGWYETESKLPEDQSRSIG